MRAQVTYVCARCGEGLRACDWRCWACGAEESLPDWRGESEWLRASEDTTTTDEGED